MDIRQATAPPRGVAAPRRGRQWRNIGRRWGRASCHRERRWRPGRARKACAWRHGGTPMTREAAPVSCETPRPGVGARLVERTPASCTPTAPSPRSPHGSAQSRRRHDDRGANCSLAAGGCERAVLLCGPGQGFRSGNGDPMTATGSPLRPKTSDFQSLDRCPRRPEVCLNDLCFRSDDPGRSYAVQAAC
jgi:hypothetical protein